MDGRRTGDSSMDDGSSDSSRVSVLVQHLSLGAAPEGSGAERTAEECLAR